MPAPILALARLIPLNQVMPVGDIVQQDGRIHQSRWSLKLLTFVVLRFLPVLCHTLGAH